VLDVTVTKAQTSTAILASAGRAMEAAFGSSDAVPDGVGLRSDHDRPTTGHAAYALARAWGVRQTFAPVGRPTGNAVAEWTIRTMREECVWLADWPDAEALAGALRAWADVQPPAATPGPRLAPPPAERRQVLVGSVPRKAA